MTVRHRISCEGGGVIKSAELQRAHPCCSVHMFGAALTPCCVTLHPACEMSGAIRRRRRIFVRLEVTHSAHRTCRGQDGVLPWYLAVLRALHSHSAIP